MIILALSAPWMKAGVDNDSPSVNESSVDFAFVVFGLSRRGSGPATPHSALPFFGGSDVYARFCP